MTESDRHRDSVSLESTDTHHQSKSIRIPDPDAAGDRGGSNRHQVYKTLKRMIISGELKPGDILNEGKLSNHLSTGKWPVREALGWLSFEGLLKPLPRYGYMITPVTIREVQELCHLREILEVEVVRLAVDRITDEEIDRLTTLDTIVDGRYDPAINREFHLTIAEASGNQRLARLIAQLLDEMERIVALDPVVWAPGASTEHVDLVDALKRRDHSAAETAAHAQVQGTRDRILERFPKNSYAAGRQLTE